MITATLRALVDLLAAVAKTATAAAIFVATALLVFLLVRFA